MFVLLLGNVHLGSTTAGNDALVLECSSDNHDRVVEGSLDLLDELFSTTTEDERARLGLDAARKQVESIATSND